MSQQNSEFWQRAYRARDVLAAQFLGHPAVSLIDIGYVMDGSEIRGDIVLRIHVRESWVNARPEERVRFPDQVDGIPVIVMRGDYRLETDT